MSDELVKADALCREIDAATDVLTVKELRDKAIALVRFYKNRHDLEAEAALTRARLRADHKIGALLSALPKAAGGQRFHKSYSPQNAASRITKQATLDEAGIDRQEASELERLAKIPLAEIDKIVAGPDGPQTPRGILSAMRKTPAKITPETLAAIDRGLDAGKSLDEIADALGMSPTPVRRRAYERQGAEAERARVAAEGPQFSRADLSLPYQAKFDAAVARYKKELAAQFDQEVSAELAKYAAATWLPSHQERLDHADKIVAARRGVMTRQTYRKILSCLHPDSRLAVSESVLNALFVEFGKLEKVLCKSEEDVAMEKRRRLHSPTPAEWEQIKQRIVAERKAAREKRAAERAAAVSG